MVNYINKKILVAELIALIILGAFGVYYTFKLHQKNMIIATNFSGGLVNIDSGASTLTVYGSFNSDKHPEVAKIPKTIKIKINDQTKITRVVVVMPTQEQLIESHGFFDGSKLQRNSSTGSFHTIVKDFPDDKTTHLNIFATASNNVYGKDSFMASEIKYEVIPTN